MIGLCLVAAVADQANVAGFDALGINQLALRGFDISPVRTDSKTGSIIAVVVKKRLNIADEVRIIGHLYDHVVVDAGLFVVMPSNDRKDSVLGFQVDDNALSPWLHL